MKWTLLSLYNEFLQTQISVSVLTHKDLFRRRQTLKLAKKVTFQPGLAFFQRRVTKTVSVCLSVCLPRVGNRQLSKRRVW
jgi:hypothetical protein